MSEIGRKEDIFERTAKRRARRNGKGKATNAAICCILTVLSILWNLPIVGIVIESFRCTGYDAVLGEVSHHWGVDNYVRLFCETAFVKWFFNTLIVGIATAIAQAAIQIFMGYALSRFRFRGRRFLMSLICVLGTIPSALLYYAMGLILNELHLTGANASPGSILIYSVNSSIGCVVAKKFFDTFDRSLSEAARVDGASGWQIFFKIFLPLAKPVVIYTLFTGFMLPWNTFSVTNTSLDGYIVADGLTGILNSSLPDAFPTFCAGGAIVSVPIAILFVLLQKYFVFGETIRNFQI